MALLTQVKLENYRITGCEHCCNDDQQSQSENGYFDPPPVDLKPLKILRPKLE